MYSFSRLSNDLVHYDRKVALLSGAFMVKHRQLDKKSCNVILFALFIYWVAFTAMQSYIWSPMHIDYNIVFINIFNVPYIVDYVVMIFTCFHLINIENRFQTLNDFWQCLPAGLVPIREEWAHSEVTMLVESIRLLHADLSTILQLFNNSYGPLLLGFFVCNFVDFTYIIYLMIYHEFALSNISLIQNIIQYIPLHIVHLQIIVFFMSIMVAASRITDKVLFF